MKQILITSIITILLIVLFISNSYSQDWGKIKPYIIYAKDKNSDTIKVLVGIGTAHPKSPLDVKGLILADSSEVSGNIKSDSLIVMGGAHIFGVLHVGQNSMSVCGQTNLHHLSLKVKV